MARVPTLKKHRHIQDGSCVGKESDMEKPYYDARQKFQVGDLIYCHREYYGTLCDIRYHFIGMVIAIEERRKDMGEFVIANLHTTNQDCIPTQPFQEYAADVKRFYHSRKEEDLFRLYHESRRGGKYTVLSAGGSGDNFAVIPKNPEAFNKVMEYIRQQNDGLLPPTFPDYSQLKSNFFGEQFEAFPNLGLTL